MQLVDETMIWCAPDRVAAIVGDPTRWPRWWPDLILNVREDRGIKGIRWSVAGSFVGSMEIWLEPHLDGTLLHHYQRLSPATGPWPETLAGQREIARVREARALAWKRHGWALKDLLESRDH